MEENMAKEHKLVQSNAEGGVASPAQPVGNAAGLRIGAIILWVCAVVFEVLGLGAIFGKIDLQFCPVLYQTIGFLLLDLVCVVIGSQLWKKANHIKPASEKNKFAFWLWNNLGLIVSVVAFLPIIVLVLANKDADKKTKTVVAVAAAVCLAIAGVTSYDFNPVSEEQQTAAMEAFGAEQVYWTKHGKVYHTSQNCQHLNRTEELIYGTVEQAIAENHVRLCKTCASRDGITNVATEE